MKKPSNESLGSRKAYLRLFLWVDFYYAVNVPSSSKPWASESFSFEPGSGGWGLLVDPPDLIRRLFFVNRFFRCLQKKYKFSKKDYTVVLEFSDGRCSVSQTDVENC